MDLELKKQAVFNSEGGVEGYEFFLGTAPGEESSEGSISRLVMITVRTLAEYGIKKIGEGKRVFMRVPLDSLTINVFGLLEPRLMVYRLLPPSAEVGRVIRRRVLESIEELEEGGAVFTASPELFRAFEEIGDKVEIVDVEVRRVAEVLSHPETGGKRVLVWGVNSRSDYESVRSLGNLFQGDYLQQPVSIDTFRVAPFLRSTLLRLLVLLNTARTPSEFSRVIGTDAGMTAKLLRFLNSAFFALRQPIRSVDQACIYFGLKNIKNFVLVLSINDYAYAGNLETWKGSLIRAKLMEELTRRADPERSGDAYLIGLLSNIDRMIETDTASFLREVNADSYIVSAFTDPSSPQARMLGMVIRVEEDKGRLLSLEDLQRDALLNEVRNELGVAPEELIEHLRTGVRMAEAIINH